MKKIFIGIVLTAFTVVTIVYGKVPEEIIDEVNIVAAVGFDRAEGQKISGTAVIPVFHSDKSIDNASFTDESVLAKEIINVLQKQSADPLVTGGLRVAIYEDELAKNGILRYVDALQRDASVGAKVYLGIIEGKTREVLEKDLGNRGTGEYLSVILEHNITKQDVPKSDLHTFLYSHYMEGLDPYLPTLKLIGDKMEITGLALFDNGTMVSKIEEENLFFFKAMVENYGEGSYTLRLKDTDEYASVKRIKTKRKIKVEEVHGSPKVNITIKFEGILSEFSGKKATPEITKQIITQLESIIKEKSEEMLKHFQEKNIDPVGIGYMARHSVRGLNFEKWQLDYPNIEIAVHAKVKLIETGITQ
ncbi:Ger(x)C family spore germination protein [Bacillus timonensis]|uniref:Ger(X)C family spore germination protein n=1 Tax=Bacillus timonensis TaxID=1033734 RepID=A0A4S3PXH8_9BACI|nr:Ger(x)C family spore germination protein [Bacillus timonensis]THE14186.1 Ger(x)C family spore germination protein [Bacillus timonensis]